MLRMPRGGWQPLSLIALALLVQLAAGRTADAAVTYTVNYGVDHAPNACQPINLMPFRDCTLREAILAANASAGFDRIEFDAFGVGTHTVNSEGQGELPAITETVTIDATGSGFRPAITQTGLGSTADGLRIANGVNGVAIKGLAIYGFGDDGIEINGTGNSVINNYIGLNAAGTAAGPGNKNGVRINGFSGTGDLNTIGGLAGANTRNVISGNTNYGIWVQSSSDNNLVQGNYIGLNAAGTAAIPNGYGVQMHGGTGNVTGGTTGTTPGACTGACNVISGNGRGIRIDSASNQSVVGNFIGTNPAGNAAIPNTVAGISVQGNNNTIGGDTANERNVISGNEDGIRLLGDNNTVTGNYVGLNAAGTAALSNGTGIWVGHPDDSIRNASQNTIGGLTPGERNIISGNDGSGISTNPGSNINTIIGNFIGSNPAGTAEIHNGSSGIEVRSESNVIGATQGVTPGGACTGACNLISGNSNGVLISGGSAENNIVQSNFIGTDVSGNSAIDNGVGIRVEAASGNTIGGITDSARNVISGNANGVLILTNQLSASDADDNEILGNYFGVNSGGDAELGNSGAGVWISGFSPTFTVDRNIIRGNVSSGGGYGFFIESDSGGQTDGTVVEGNLIGTNAAGTAAIPNGSGIEILSGGPGDVVANTRIGGPNPADANVISGNLGHGVVVRGAAATGTTMQNNLIGVDATGTAPLGNSFFGVRLAEGAHDNTIGGIGEGNVIAANGTGIRIGDPTTTGNLIRGNFIGTNAGLDTGLGNVNEGVYISNAAGNTVGGAAEGAGNVIVYNGAQNVDASGVRVQDTDALGNRISRNSIYSNAALGIQLDAGGNNDQAAPVLTSAENGSTHITGTLNSSPNTTYRIEAFSSPACDPSGSGEGKTFIGFTDVTTNGGGTVAIDVTFPATAAAGEQVTATATDPDGNTSEFSGCVEVTGSATPTPTPSPTSPGQTPTPTPTATPPGQTPTPTPTATPPGQTPKPTGSPADIQGDVTCDNNVTSVDSLFLLREVAGLGAGACAGNGDVNCDGNRTSVDALGVLRYVAGLPVNQNEPCADIGTEV